MTPIGTTAVLNSDALRQWRRQRAAQPARARTSLSENATGVQFVVTLNHFKSKGSACDAPDTGDGQGNCAAVRTTAANLIAPWLASDPTGAGTETILIFGDLNSYAKESPIAALEGAGFTNLVAEGIGPDAYSYAFDGQWDYLDYALANDALLPDVTGVAEWHINADEPALPDYNDRFQERRQLSRSMPPTSSGSLITTPSSSD